MLAVFVPMLVFSSLHVHEGGTSSAGAECTDCVEHCCHGHLSQMASWTHDCVLCHFQTLTMLTAAVIAVAVYINVFSKCHSLPSQGRHTVCCGTITTRGP